MKLIRIGIVVVATFVFIASTVWVIGVLLPKRHQASVAIELRLPPAAVWRLVRDIESSVDWREGVTSIERLADRPIETWAETGEFGVLHYQVDSEQAPTRLVMRIVDNDAFGGTWTYEIQETGTPGLTKLAVTEDGEIYSPLFRFFARFVFGYSSTLEAYAQDIMCTPLLCLP